MFDLIYPPSPAEVLPKPTAENPVAPATGGSEMLPVIRENGLVYAQASRAYCHGGSMLLHPVVHLHIINSNFHTTYSSLHVSKFEYLYKKI